MISIIVPVYNVEKYICRCIDSILDQTYKDFELILVDDGSTDSSGKICDDYKKRDKRIKVIHKENGGLSSARNIGLDIAEGDYIGFIDSDDYIRKDMYEVLYNDIVKYHADISICSYKEVNEYFQPKNIRDNNKIEIYEGIDSLNQLYKNNRVKFIVAWNKLYDKSIFKNLRYEEGKIHEDELIIHKLLLSSKLVTYNSKEMYYYLQREDSIMKKEYSISNLSYINALSDRIILFYKEGLDELQERAESEYLSNFFKYYFLVKEKDMYNLKEFKSNFIDILKIIIKKDRYTLKEKISWLIFCLNENTYKKYIMKGRIISGKLDNGNQA